MKRIPLEARKTKESAKLFLQNKNLNEYSNEDLNTLKNWVIEHDKKDLFSQVEKIEYIGMLPVIDLTVEKDHSYSANGIIVHNCNLPSKTPKETVAEIYMAAWEQGCKGFTIYRDGCRDGVLITNESKDNKSSDLKFETHNAPKRQKEINCEIHHATVQGEKWNIFVGLLDGKPYEVMGGLSKYVSIPKRIKNGKIVKASSGTNARYDLHYDYEESQENETIIRDIGNVFVNSLNGAFTRTISLSLRHGTPVQYIVEQLQKGSDDDSDFFSFAKVLARVMKKYIVDGIKPTGKQKCTECGSENLVYKEGCIFCISCSASKCS